MCSRYAQINKKTFLNDLLVQLTLKIIFQTEISLKKVRDKNQNITSLTKTFQAHQQFF